MVDAQSNIDVGTSGGSGTGTILVESGPNPERRGLPARCDRGHRPGGHHRAERQAGHRHRRHRRGQLQIGPGATLALTSYTSASGSRSASPAPAALAGRTAPRRRPAERTRDGERLRARRHDRLFRRSPVALGRRIRSGTLTFNGPTGAIGALTLAGNFAGLAFQVTPGAGGVANVTLVPVGSGQARLAPVRRRPTPMFGCRVQAGPGTTRPTGRTLTPAPTRPAVAPGSNDG